MRRYPACLAVLAMTGAVLAFWTVGAAASPASSSASATQKPIVIGWVKAASGFMSFFDVPLANAAELAVKDINAKGGVLGRPLKLVYSDYKTNVSLVLTATQNVLDKNPNFVVTGCDYDFGSPAARLANSKNILAVGCAGSTRYGLKGIGPLTFNTWHGNPAEAGVMAEFVFKRWKRPYFVQDLTIDYSKEVCSLSQKTWAHLAGSENSIAGKDTMQNGDASFSAQVNRIKASKADVVVLCSFPPGGVTLIKQLRAAGVTLPIVGDGDFEGGYWLSAIPNLSNFYAAGGVASVHGDDPNAKINAFMKRYKKAYGPAPAFGGVSVGYSTIEMLAKAIAKAKSTEAGKVKSALETFRNVSLLAGTTTYTRTCHVPAGRALVVTKVTNGKERWFSTFKPKWVAPHDC